MEDFSNEIDDYTLVVPPLDVRPIKNTVVLSMSFLLCYTAFQAIQSLQSSLNQTDGLGMTTLACVYSAIIVAGVLSPMIIHQLGTKLSFIFAWAAHCVYTAANFYPSWWTLVPASLLLGAAAAPMWTAQGIYITTMADAYSRSSNMELHEAMSKLFGVFGLLFQSAQITGNLIASFVLFRDEQDEFHGNVSMFCGANDCPGISRKTDIVARPEQSTVMTLMGVYFTCDFIGLLVTMFFLTPIPNDSSFGVTSKEKVKEWFMSLKDVNIALLLPFYFAKSMVVAILLTSFSKAFISCVVGIRFVGYVMATYGASTSVLAYIFGFLAKFTNRYVLFATSYILELSAVCFMLLWKPGTDTFYMCYIFVVICAISDGIWMTQSASLIGILFKDKRDTAFANFSTFGALAFTVPLAYDHFVCLSTKLYISLALLVVGAVCYCTLEVKVAYNKSGSDTTGYEEIN